MLPRSPFFMLITLLLASSVSGDPVTLVDAVTGAEITTGFLRIEDGDVSRDYLFLPAQPLVLPSLVSRGRVLVRTGETETFNYHAPLDAGPPPTRLMIHPVGLVQGSVEDGRSNLLSGVTVVFTCPTSRGSASTDAAGRFSFYLPAERCILSVVHKGRSGSAEVTVIKGGMNTVAISVVQPITVAQRSTAPFILWLLLSIIIGLGLLLFMLRRSRPVRNLDTGDGAENPFLVERVKEVLKEKERLIVDRLLLAGGTLSLRELRFQTRVPRTSLLRTLQGLESRNLLIKREEHGRLVVSLSR